MIFIKKMSLFVIVLLSFLFIKCAGSRSSQTGELSFISIDEELTLGEDISSFTLRYLDIIRNRTLNSFLNSMAKNIGAVSHWSGLPYSVFVINDHNINHFSLPGGNIYIFRGLLETAENSDEIAIILAHEIAHLTERDAVARLAEKYGFSFAAQSVIGENPEIAEHIIMSLYKEGTILDYPAADEYRADQLALEYVLKAGYNPKWLPVFLEKIAAIEKQTPDRTKLLQMTHPSIRSRIRKAQKNLKKLSLQPNPPSPLPVSFQQAKQALAKIPG